MRAHVEEALGELSDQQRAVVAIWLQMGGAKVHEKNVFTEISEVLGISRQAAKQCFERAKPVLRRLLEEWKE